MNVTVMAKTLNLVKSASNHSGGKGKPRPLRQDALIRRAHEVLLMWSTLSPETHRVNISALATELNVSRQALYDNGLAKEIHRYKKLQIKNFSGGRSTPNHKPAEQKIELEDQLKDLQQKLDGWIERWAAVEYNARMLGIDPDEIFAPIPHPQRTGMSDRRNSKPTRRWK